MRRRRLAGDSYYDIADDEHFSAQYLRWLNSAAPANRRDRTCGACAEEFDGAVDICPRCRWSDRVDRIRPSRLLGNLIYAIERDGHAPTETRWNLTPDSESCTTYRRLVGTTPEQREAGERISLTAVVEIAMMTAAEWGVPLAAGRPNPDALPVQGPHEWVPPPREPTHGWQASALSLQFFCLCGAPSTVDAPPAATLRLCERCRPSSDWQLGFGDVCDWLLAWRERIGRWPRRDEWDDAEGLPSSVAVVEPFLTSVDGRWAETLMPPDRFLVRGRERLADEVELDTAWTELLQLVRRTLLLGTGPVTTILAT